MKIQNERIAVSGNEIDDIAQYPLSREFDKYLSDILSFDIEYDQANIQKFLEISQAEWNEVPLDYQPDDDVFREYKNFKSFIKRGKQLSAREASLILRYTGEAYGEERAVAENYLPGDFARDIAITSLLHASAHTAIANTIRIVDRGVHELVRAMPDSETARQAWIGTLYNNNDLTRKAYWNELKRKNSEQTAAESMANIHMLQQSFNFELSFVDLQKVLAKYALNE